MNKDNLENIFNDDFGSSYFPQLAEDYFQEGDYDRAEKVLEIGLLLNPNNNDGKYIKAKIAMITSDIKTAVSLLKEIIDSDPLYINAMKMLVMHYQSSETNQVSMMNILHQIIALSPQDEFANERLKSQKKKSKRKPAAKKMPKKLSQSVSKATGPKKAKKITKNQRKKPAKKDTPVDLAIDSKMATLTFVDILIRQKQYMQADNVLKVVKKNKSISRSSIEQRIKRINKGLSKEK